MNLAGFYDRCARLDWHGRAPIVNDPEYQSLVAIADNDPYAYSLLAAFKAAEFSGAMPPARPPSDTIPFTHTTQGRLF
jgi:hypothetical protein